MTEHFSFFLVLAVIIVCLIMLGNKIKIAYPVLLVIAGLLISFIPGIPVLKINPEYIFIIFLPPLLYEAAWAGSWKELWHWRRIIGSFAFVVVFLTAILVAVVANYFIPGMTLALGFLLGGIVSPPDAVSASAILKFVKVPKRMSTILEGESLLNDASSLIIFRFSLIAVGTGQFIWHQAAMSFVWMVFAGVAIGLSVGLVFMKAHKWLPTDVNMDVVFTLVAPYAMYILAEDVHASGVLAVVSGGLLLSSKRNVFLSSSTRLGAGNVWYSFVFLLNGFVFMLIGLDLPEIVEGLRTEGTSFSQATFYGVLITGVLILARMVASYGAVITTFLMRNIINVADRNSPGFKAPFVLGWTGMRGVVSLAAALSIPVLLEDGTPFPHRNLILYITFLVILLTLIVQGLTLPFIISNLNLPKFDDHYEEEKAEKMIQKLLAKASLDFVEQQSSAHQKKCFFIQKMVEKWTTQFHNEDPIISEMSKHTYLQVLSHQRNILNDLNLSDARMDEEVIRKFQHKIDLEEEKIKAE